MSTPPKRLEDYPHRLRVKTHLCEILGVGKDTAYQIVNRADFPKFKVRHRWLIPRDAFFDWFNKVEHLPLHIRAANCSKACGSRYEKRLITGFLPDLPRSPL